MVFNFYTVTSFVNFLASGIIAFFVIIKNRRDPKNLSFFILASLIALWSLSYFFWQNVTDNAQAALFWCRVLIGFVIMVPAAYFHFSVAISDLIKKYKRVVILSYLLFFLFLLSDFTPFFVERVRPIMGFKYWPVATPLLTVFIIFFGIFVALSSLILIKKYRSSAGIVRLQIKYVAVGFIIAILSGSFNYLPWYGIPIPPIPNLFVPAYVILMAYAITRYRLMDIKVVLRNVVFYSAISFSLYIAFYIIAISYKFAFGSVLAEQGYLIGLCIAPLIAMIMYSGNRFLSNFANRYNYQHIIKKTAEELSKYVSLDKISQIITSTIEKTLQPSSVALFFMDERNNFYAVKSVGFSEKHEFAQNYKLFSAFFKRFKKILIKDEIDQLIYSEKSEATKELLSALRNVLLKSGALACVPISDNSRLAGIIALGPRSDKESYTKEDFSFLETLSHQAYISLQNALLYKKLDEKNKYLEELLDAKNDFIRIANHQLNTPFSVLRNAYSMLKDGSLPFDESLVYFENGLKRMDEVLQDFWSIFELAGEIKMTIQKTDIEPIIREAVEIEEKNIVPLGKKIRIFAEKPKFDIPHVMCDSKKMRQVIHNILDNAVLYTSKGIIKISYSLLQEKTNSYLKISIKDTGIGFSSQDKKKISQKFFRSRKALLFHPDGSGLGLFISQKIIEGNGGRLSLESEGENKGSIFSFTLPVFK